jgi:hypothetical protein
MANKKTFGEILTLRKLIFTLFFIMFVAGGVFAQQGARVKTTNSRKLWDFSYWIWSDGCVTSDHHHYDLYGRHNNDIGYVNSQIDFFNSQVKRLGCIDQAYQQDYFNRSNIGDVFYVSYSGTLNKIYHESSTKYGQGGPYVIHSLIIWEVKVVEK